MFEWIAHNKEWLFSGVGVALIIGVVKTLNIVRNRRKATLSKKEKAIFDRPLSTPPVPSSKSTVSLLQPAEVEMTMDSKAPLLQKEVALRHYEGLFIEWKGEVVSASKSGATIVIQVVIPHRRIRVFFDIDPRDYPDVILFRGGDIIKFMGEIEDIKPPCVNLKHAKIISYDKNEQTEP